MNYEDIKVSRKNGLYTIAIPPDRSIGYNIINSLKQDLPARFTEMHALKGEERR